MSGKVKEYKCKKYEVAENMESREFDIINRIAMF